MFSHKTLSIFDPVFVCMFYNYLQKLNALDLGLTICGLEKGEWGSEDKRKS